MTSPHPLVAWVERNQADQPRRTPAQRFAPEDVDDVDDLTERRRARARSRSRVRKAQQVSRVRYS